jgi:transposase-like protein
MRSRSTSDFRAAVLQRFATTGLSLAEFCRREGLAYQSVLGWRSAQRLADDGSASGSAAVAAEGARPEFLEVACAEDFFAASAAVEVARKASDSMGAPLLASARSQLILEVALPGGACLRMFSVTADSVVQ